MPTKLHFGLFAPGRASRQSLALRTAGVGDIEEPDHASVRACFEP